MVTYYFPPSGGPGVQRMLKFTKYLPKFGWRPLVLTVRDDAEYPVLDSTLWNDVPEGVRIVRTGITEFYRLYRSLSGSSGPLDISTRSAKESFSSRALRSLRASLFVPDGRVGWIPHALGPGKKLAVDGRAAAILSSGPPFTTNLIGGLLHRRLRIPWIQDFRDPWTQAPFYPKRPGLIRRLDERLEAWSIRNATRTLTVNEWIRDDFIRRYPDVNSERLVTLPNGFDKEDFEGIERTEPGKFRLVHTGSLFAARDPQALRIALADLCGSEKGFVDSVEVVLAGRIDAELAATFRAPPLDRIVRMPGYLEHAETLRLLRSAHLCLLFVGQEKAVRGMVTGKVFEYLGSGTPILALAPEGEAAELIHRCRAGIVVSPEDTRGLRELLRSLWTRFRSCDRILEDPDAGEIAHYERRHLTSRLARLLDEICGFESV